MTITKTMGHMFKRYTRAETGSATIEHILWIPLLATFLTLGVDATILMHKQTELNELSRDAARMVAVGQKTIAEAETATLDRVPSELRYGVNIELDGDYVVASVSLPFDDVVVFTDSFVGSASLAGEVYMWVEGTDESEE